MQTFLNSRWDLTSRNEEELSSPEAVSAWFVEHGLFDRPKALTESDRRRVLEVREGFRELLFVNNGASEDPEAVARLNRELRAPRVYIQFAAADTPQFKPHSRDLDGALALLATIVAVSQIDGSWSRMKACPGPDCGWAFYDHSRNQASNWCAMSVCGSRAKVRAYRKRRRDPAT
ncbi:MAG: CGNR zinc finger domain-containing protein [Solirubrobacteraceae bacterium]